MKHPNHSKQLTRLKRVEGQVRGIQKMVEEGRYCMDIVIQVQAAISALKGVQNQIIHEHLDHCVRGSLLSNNPAEADQKIKEILLLLKKIQ